MLLLMAVIALAIAFGLLLRTSHLSAKPYWLDESYTLLRSSGFTAQTATRHLYGGRLLHPADLLRYQHPSRGDGGPAGTIAGLAREEPQHPPLYFLLTRLWQQGFGASKPSVRSLPVLGSLLAVPALYWLCRELFASPLVAWLAVALMAVSPISLRFAQEARPYSLWTALVLLSCAALLRALAHSSLRNWAAYSILTLLAVLCHLLTGLVVLAQVLYVAGRERLRFSRNGLAMLTACLFLMIAGLPWLAIVWNHREVVALTTEHSALPMAWSDLARFWGLGLTRVFVSGPARANPLLIGLALPLLILCGWALLVLVHRGPRTSSLFLLILLGSLALPFVIADLSLGGRRTTNFRYFLPFYVVLQIAVAHLLATGISRPGSSRSLRLRWFSLTLGLLLAGSLSCLTSVGAATWWGWSEFDLAIAGIVNSHARPLLISDVPFGAIAPLAHELKAETRILLLAESDALRLPGKETEVFLYNPSPRLRAQVRAQGFRIPRTYRFRDDLTRLEVTLHRLQPDT